MSATLERRKPGPTARARRAKAVKDRRVAGKIRKLVAKRDQHCCRLSIWQDEFGTCDGRLEWAHLGDKQRFKTRGMAPEARHTTAETLMLCTRHHDMYDDGEIQYRCTTDRGANGPILWETAA